MSQEVQKIERQWLDRFQQEKERNRTREKDQKRQLLKISNEQKIEVQNYKREINRSNHLKKSNS